MPGNARGADEPGQAAQRLAHPRAGLDVEPPTLAIGRAVVPLALRLDVGAYVLERGLVERRLVLGHVNAEIDDPHVAGSSRNIKAVGPRSHNIAVGATVRVAW